ncbi:MAG TPA: DUF4386 domain-containing protein [Candidatus Acidoferrales bacterium]|nr:DUF4386 domain-containing protein [Candidatus Acidoferrales bacterium]
MAIYPVDDTQRAAAKAAGFLYIFTLLTANFAEFYARGSLISPSAMETARNIAASERLFRLGAVGNLLTFAGCVPLLLALYVVLKPVSKNLALLGAFWRLAECAIFAIIILNDFLTLRLLSGADYLHAFDASQLQALAYTFVHAHDAGYLIGLVFYGLGSTTFSYLFYKSRYIPRALSALGVFASLLVAIVSLVVMVFPESTHVVSPAFFIPSFLFEVILGLWLLIKGIKAPSLA